MMIHDLMIINVIYEKQNSFKVAIKSLIT